MASHGLILALGLLVGLSVTVHAEPLDEPLKPLPPIPTLDPKRVQLGLRLFNDPRLSVNNTLSCASCHRLDKGGADEKRFSLGFDGKPVEFNTPTVFNASLNFHQFWDGRVDTLEEQVHIVVTSPAEMGSTWETVLKRIGQDPDYARGFDDAYPDGVTQANIQGALADYERTLLTPNSRFDQYLLGNTDILTPREKFGYQRFKEYGCIACHQGVNIGGNMFQKFGVMGDYIQDRGNPTRADDGRFNVTGDEADRQVFKVPSLRNVAITAPYFHAGSAPTLENAVEVMFKYQLGREPLKNDTELIVEFLKTLTGEWEGKPL
ncbi:cytochrome B6 [Pseudomonas sp. Fig-3]|uniref:cytochrome-c peroxidase n=1 Tax=unclassified Pseudomonas TaxID=196821 RepID=UPI0010F1F0CD|nr:MULTISPECIES: cytochrome c peroxidase [unclassified Pseudomonas]TNB86336.1 cytochrome B6 [Pseudomonas sp. Fig-3]VII89691.1 Cytochrome c551 peroxidase (EC 1.11.1.5) [Pseudomonas sp. FG-3G]